MIMTFAYGAKNEEIPIVNPCTLGFDCPFKARDISILGNTDVCTHPYFHGSYIYSGMFQSIDEKICPKMKQDGSLSKIMRALSVDSAETMKEVERIGKMGEGSEMIELIEYAKGEDMERIARCELGDYKLYNVYGIKSGSLVIRDGRPQGEHMLVSYLIDSPLGVSQDKVDSIECRYKVKLDNKRTLIEIKICMNKLERDKPRLITLKPINNLPYVEVSLKTSNSEIYESE